MTQRGGRRAAVGAAVAVLLLAMCLRAPISTVGPVLERIGADTGLDPTALGLLGALPVLGFGVGSALVHRPSTRFGLDRVIAAALAALATAVVVRSLPVPGALWVGTVVIGISIAAGNVLAPAVIKRDHPRRLPLVTAAFTAVMTTTAALASGLMLPVSDRLGGGWRWPLGLFAVVVVLIAALWAVRAARSSRTGRASDIGPVHRWEEVSPRAVKMWRSPSAWLITAFMGLQSTTFYTLSNWLPTVEAALGVDPRSAGPHLFVLHFVGMPAGLLLARLMRGRTDLRALGVAISLCNVIAMAGLLLAPGVAVVWVGFAAVGTSCSLVLGLSLFGLRTAHPRHTAQLSAMAQTVGYAMAAACGPLLAGWLGGTFGWRLVLLVGAGLAAVQVVVVLGAARPGLILGR